MLLRKSWELGREMCCLFCLWSAELQRQVRKSAVPEDMRVVRHTDCLHFGTCVRRGITNGHWPTVPPGVTIDSHCDRNFTFCRLVLTGIGVKDTARTAQWTHRSHNSTFLVHNPVAAQSVQKLNFLSFMDFDNRQRRLVSSAHSRGRLEEAPSRLFGRHHEPMPGKKAVEKRTRSLTFI